MEYLNVRNGSFIGSGSNLGATNRRLPVPENLYKSFAIFSKMEMQLSPFLLCNFRYFYFTTNKLLMNALRSGSIFLLRAIKKSS